MNPFNRKNATSLKEKPMFTTAALVSLILPLLGEQLLAVTVGMADTLMVTSCGEAAVSGVNLVDSVNILFIQLFAALATGGAVVCAQYLGKDDHRRASDSAKQLLYFSAVFALTISVIAVAFNQSILRLIFGSIEQDVMDSAEIYFFLTALSYPALAVYNAAAAFFRSMGKSRTTLYIALMVNAVNIGGNALLIYGFDLGVAGAAIATLVARTLGSVLGLVLLCNSSYAIRIEHLFSYRPDFPSLRRILAIGIPTGLENSLFQLGKVALSSLISTFGTASIAANAMVNTLASFSNVPGSAVGLGLITVIGQCMGAGKTKQAEKYTYKLVGVTYLFMGLMDVALFVFAEPLCGFFGFSTVATTLGIRILRGFVIATVIWPTAFTIPNALRAAGDAKYTMIISLISMFFCRVALAYFLAATTDLGLHSVWLAMYADWVVRTAFFTVHFIRGKWKTKKVI